MNNIVIAIILFVCVLLLSSSSALGYIFWNTNNNQTNLI